MHMTCIISQETTGEASKDWGFIFRCQGDDAILVFASQITLDFLLSYLFINFHLRVFSGSL